MKTCKSKTCKAFPVSEECGVWLDASQFRPKKQTKLTRPISKLLNPRSGGYSVAVALNFTQTKMEMPVTKQSTISSFFLPQRKKGTDAEVHNSPWRSGMSSTPLPEGQTGTKRKHELIFELPSELEDASGHSCRTEPQERDAEVEKVSFDDDDKERQFLHLIWGYQSEECEPAGKRRPPENIRDENVTDTREDSSKDMKKLKEEIPVSLPHRAGYRTHQENFQMLRRSIWDSSASPSTEGVCTQERLKDQTATEKRSTIEIRNTMKKKVVTSHKEPFERMHQWSPGLRKGKENSRASSPRRSAALSPFEQHARSSPADRSSDFTGRLCLTPKKSIGEAQENDEDSFTTLFTQDSEGFRVIAHSSRRSRCPLQDQTNSREATEQFSIPSVMEVDPELEMLFTQDSQGNVVIKH